MLEWADISAVAVPETVTFHNGKSITLYRIPAVRKGPLMRRDRRGAYLVYLYSSFVFRWYAGESAVRIYHGDIDCSDEYPLPWTVEIDTEWDPITLTHRAQQWVRAHCAQFEKKRG
ncbi:hypothetical protein A8926_3592 [Saccharopolyspora spinosa]|uniref:Uncharacterized protein n=1 Tax=Saccharopolyspora spinosa TaxID=60894 RepID=A0A2N3XYU9_SACSN|nr:hypothetical protein A8926_3592 [Saccharopolyspora spinosa]